MIVVKALSISTNRQASLAKTRKQSLKMKPKRSRTRLQMMPTKIDHLAKI